MSIEKLDNLESFKVKFTTIVGDLHEGPLGLLWRLIESYEVDIFQVSLSRITEDFVSHIKTVIVNLEEEANFVLMASKLLFYKSKLLLPNPGFEDDQEPDSLPFELVEQLLEYKKYQMAAESLKDIEEKTHLNFTRESSWADFEQDLDLFEVDVISFLKAFKEFMINAEKNAPYQIVQEEVSMDAVIENMIQVLGQQKKIYFFDYIKNFTVPHMIVAFLAVLELVKLRFIKVVQHAQCADIELISLIKAGINN
ncbi:MAG: segregation/condensation protein A [Spirochaetia bacterium]|nr:segregation/condensation protein A [Spirochaetia bacterium]